MSSDRDTWTAYAARIGAILPPEPVMIDVTPLSKYRAAPVTIDGIRFASRKEGARYLELRLLEKTGAIAELERQPVFPLYIMELWRSQAPIKVFDAGKYTADFRYVDLATGEIVVEDVKSDATRTTDYKLRKTIAEHVHGFHVQEV